MIGNLLRRLFLPLSLCAVLAACSEDNTEPQKPASYAVTEFVSSDIPATIPAEGGSYKMTLSIRTETRAASGAGIFEVWQYRVTLGDAAGEPVIVSEATTEVPIVIGENFSPSQRSVTVEMAVVSESAAPKWTRVVNASQEAAATDYRVTDYKSTTIPETVPYGGGKYTMSFETSIETRAAEPIFVEWQYRMSIGSTVGEPVIVTQPTENVDVEIAGNYTETERDITVEMAHVETTPVWAKIVRATQEPALMPIADFYWAKGNVTLRDGKFALADKMSDAGLFFRHGSRHGVLSEGSFYSGTAYTPEPVQIALADIPCNKADTDPCTMIDANLRTPTYMEFYYLFDREDQTNLHILDGVTGMGYHDTDYFIPFSGTVEIASGQISGRSKLASYLALGSNFAGEGLIYAINEEYSELNYDESGTNMASLRCVRNIRQPSLVSHTPTTTADNASFKLSIKTDHGDFPFYEVALEASDGKYTQTDATSERTQFDMTVPRNDAITEREWRIYVNRVYTGASFVQPGMKDYALYVSHTPAESTYEAFTLSVKCESSLVSFPVVIKGSDGLELTLKGSKDNPDVSFEIPENNGKKRKLAIWVNGVDTKQSVVQQANPASSAFSVVWSEGYLTVVDGRYAFAAPRERGMYFKWNSKYGIRFDGVISGSTKYLGVVYGPEQQSIPDYADIPGGDIDPCSLVAPAGTWYMPDTKMFGELIADGSEEFEAYVFRMCTDGDQKVYLGTSGQLHKDGGKTLLPNIISVWTSDESATRPGQYSYLMWTTSLASTAGSVSAGGVVPQTGMMVRCVRDK